MSDQKEVAKIEKFVEKRKSAPIIKLMGKADSDVLVAALEGLGKIADEDSFNQITHYLEHEDAKVRVAACKAALVVNTECAEFFKIINKRIIVPEGGQTE